MTVYSPKLIPSKNRNKVVMELEIDAEAIAVAGPGPMKVIKVNYRGGGPSIPGNETLSPSIASCSRLTSRRVSVCLARREDAPSRRQPILWLPQQKLPLPGAVGLNTCSCGSNPGDSRYMNNGPDATLSTAFTRQPPFGRRNPTARKPTDPPATALDGEIPKGYALFCCRVRAACV